MNMKIIGALSLMQCALLAGCNLPAANTSTTADVAPSMAIAQTDKPATRVQPQKTNPAVSTPSPAKTTTIKLDGGLTLFAPAGWTSQPPVATKVVLVTPANDSLVIASLDPGDISLASAELRNGIAMGNGVFLRPSGAPVVTGGVHSNNFVATGSATEAHAIVMIRATNGGRLLSLIGLAPPSQIDMVRKAMSGMMASAKVGQAAAPSSNGELATYLKGRYLVRFYSGNGYSEKHEIWLCSNGEFRSRFDGGGFTQGVASGAFAGSNSGTWGALGARSNGSLTLSATNGSVSSFDIRETADGLMLNGSKWLRGENQLCN